MHHCAFAVLAKAKKAETRTYHHCPRIHLYVLKRAVLLQTHALMLKERAEVIEELHVRTFCAAGRRWNLGRFGTTSVLFCCFCRFLVVTTFRGSERKALWLLLSGGFAENTGHGRSSMLAATVGGRRKMLVLCDIVLNF